MNAERSFAAPRTFTDAHIEFWAAVYLDPRNKKLRQVRFERFLRAPRAFVLALERPRIVITACGLLPAQRTVQRRLDLQDALIEMAECAVRAMRGESHCADGRWTEKTRHHAWPRHRGRKVTKEAA